MGMLLRRHKAVKLTVEKPVETARKEAKQEPVNAIKPTAPKRGRPAKK